MHHAEEDEGESWIVENSWGLPKFVKLRGQEWWYVPFASWDKCFEDLYFNCFKINIGIGEFKIDNRCSIEIIIANHQWVECFMLG